MDAEFTIKVAAELFAEVARQMDVRTGEAKNRLPVVPDGENSRVGMLGAAQLSLLKDLSIDRVQGFHMGMPVCADERSLTLAALDTSPNGTIQSNTLRYSYASETETHNIVISHYLPVKKTENLIINESAIIAVVKRHDSRPLADGWERLVADTSRQVLSR